MKRSRQHAYLLLGFSATQILLGCADDSEVIPAPPATVVVPSDITRPKELVGSWKSEGSGQDLALHDDGAAEFVNHISINASNTGGQKMEAKVPAKWGIKDNSLYFFDFKNSPAITYKWAMKGGKLELDSGGRVKLLYARSTEAKSP